MSKFTEPLVVSPLKNGKEWKLVKSFRYSVGLRDVHGTQNTIEVPSGFVTDFTTIPSIFWFLYPRWGKYGNASVVHDYLYKKQLFSRKYADYVFKEAMEVLKVNWFTIHLFYYLVRLFGFIAWKRNTLQ